MKNALLPLFPFRKCLLALLAAWLCTASALPAAETLQKEFDLPADAAERTLKLFAAQSGLEVLFVTSTTDGVRTTAVRGTMAPIEAARRMLAGTKLSAGQDERSGAVIITSTAPPEGQEKNVESRRANDATTAFSAEADLTGNIMGRVADASTSSFLPGAEIRLRETGQNVVSSRDGRFVFRGIPAGSYIVDASYVGYGTRSFPVSVTAGQTSELDVKLTPEIIRLETFRVEGAREGQARALSEQRAATNLKNLVSADSIGNFPDVNAAAALKRIPGISTVRQRGEDRDITIRGAAPNLNSITIDGVSVLSNQVDGRTVSMDVYPAEQLAGIEIVKSVTPDMDGDSIGGAINLRTKSAFDVPNRVIAANAYWQYNDMADASSYRTGLNFSDVVGEKREWGVQFSASFARRIALEENGETAGWALRSGTAAGVPYSGYTPNNLPFNNVDIERERTGGSLSLERKFGDATLLYLRASHNEFVERNGRPRVVVQAAGNVSAAHPVISEGDRLVQYTSTAVRGQRVVNPREFTDTGTSIALGGRTIINEWNLELVGSLARGTNHQDSVTGQWRTAGGTTASIDLRDSERPAITHVAGPDLNDESAYAFNQLQVQDRRLKNLEYSLKGDASREFLAGGNPFKLQSGFKLRWSPKKWDQQTSIYNSLTSGTLNLNDPRMGGTYEVNPDFLDGLMDFGPTVAPFAFAEFAKNNLALFVPNAGNTLQNSLGSDYYVGEGIYAGYVSGEWTVGRLTALAGVRYERTEVQSKGFSQNTALPTSNPARYSWVGNDSSYDDVLPGVHLRYAQTKDFILRASWNNTLARPQTNRISPSLNVTMPANPSESDRVIVSGGNPDLKATRSANLDLSAEYYLKSIGLFSVGYFHKDLEGPIYRRTFDTTYEGNPATLTVFDNAGDARVSGWEFVYQQQFSFLPGLLDGLGFYANYTLVDSEVTLTEPGRVGEQLSLFNQSDELGNLALTYQKNGLFIRLSRNWRGDYLQALADPGLDEYAGKFKSFDLLVSYKISPRWMLKFEATNFTSEPERQYVGVSSRSLYFGDTGRTYSLGMTFDY